MLTEDTGLSYRIAANDIHKLHFMLKRYPVVPKQETEEEDVAASKTFFLFCSTVRPGELRHNPQIAIKETTITLFYQWLGQE